MDGRGREQDRDRDLDRVWESILEREGWAVVVEGWRMSGLRGSGRYSLGFGVCGGGVV